MNARAYLLALFLVCSTAGGFSAERWDVNGAPHLEEGLLTEASGLASSLRVDGGVWSLNDSGGRADLFLFDLPSGRQLGSVSLAGVKNRDWESLDSFLLEGEPWLLIADTGDNRSRRETCTLLLVKAPPLSVVKDGREIRPARQITFRYQDGPRDCEAVAVDPGSGKVLLLSKRTWPPVAYELPLFPAEGTVAVARRLGPVNLPKAAPWEGPYASQNTGLAIRPDGKLAAVLTYGRVFLFPRGAGQSWRDAFAAKPQRLPRHGLPQAEGICFSKDGQSLLVVSEGRGAPVLRYGIEAP
jgi:hypothetical protein